MDNLTEKLMQILGNKQNFDKIKNLTGLLSFSEGNDEKSNQKTSENSSPTDGIPIDAMAKVMKIMPLLSSVNKEDENAKFLKALRPHLKNKRQKKLDEAIKMMQIFKILPILKEQDIFQF